MNTRIREKIIAFFCTLMLILTSVFSVALLGTDNVSAIENGRNDLGILDSLKITNKYGNEINEGSNIHNGEQYTLMYKFSLDEPTSDYKSKSATFNIPDIFKSNSLNPAPMKLIYDDGTDKHEIGTVTANLTTGTINVQFNDSAVLGTKSNINGWISLTATADSTVGNHDIIVKWTGSDETSISVKVDNGSVGTNRVAELNKYLASASQSNGQPTVLQKADGTFYVSFAIEVLISKGYPELTVKDYIYSGLKIDSSSVKVFSRPRDSQEYYSASGATYKANYDAWRDTNANGVKAVEKNITADLNADGKIEANADGLTINFTNVDFDNTLVSRQLTTTPLQMRYKITYDTILTNIDPSLNLSEAQTVFKSQNARNDAKLLTPTSTERETTWIKAALGGGATGETRAVTLHKVDKDTKEALSGAVFNLYKQNAYNSDLWELYKPNISMNTSSVLVDGLTFGNYRFQEITAPEDYLLPDEPFEPFAINAETSLTDFEITLENIKSQQIKPAVDQGALQFEKVDSADSSIKLKAATFEIRKKDNDESVTTVVTNSNGVGSVSNLEVGDYYLIEKTAPDGYELDNTRYDFKITKDTVNNLYFGDKAIKNTKTAGKQDKPGKPDTPDKLDDPDKPIDSSKTGDNNNMLLWLGMTLLSASALGALIIIRKKHKA